MVDFDGRKPTLRFSHGPGRDPRSLLVEITLRALVNDDLDTLFEWERDPRAVQMAAFTRANPSDRSAFDAHYERVRSDPSATLLAIDDGSEFVGTVASFPMEEVREIAYWIAPERWGQGLASQGLQAFLEIELTRPLYGRVADYNRGSATVLARAGLSKSALRRRSRQDSEPKSSSASTDSTTRRSNRPTVRERPTASVGVRNRLRRWRNTRPACACGLRCAPSCSSSLARWFTQA